MDLYSDTQWFLKPSFDLEMKQYQCLAIGQRVSKDIDMVKLWPWHDYLHETVKMMSAFQENVKTQKDAWKKALRHIDLKNKALFYESDEPGNDIEDVHQIIEFAYPKLNALNKRLINKKEDVLSNWNVSHLGLFASDLRNGFLAVEHLSGLRLYDYYLPSITYRNKRLNLTYLDTVDQNLSTPKLIKHVYQIVPGPYKQFWYVSGTNDLPVEESLEPLLSSYMVDVIQEVQ